MFSFWAKVLDRVDFGAWYQTICWHQSRNELVEASTVARCRWNRCTSSNLKAQTRTEPYLYSNCPFFAPHWHIVAYVACSWGVKIVKAGYTMDIEVAFTLGCPNSSDKTLFWECFRFLQADQDVQDNASCTWGNQCKMQWAVCSAGDWRCRRRVREQCLVASSRPTFATFQMLGIGAANENNSRSSVL